MFMMQKVLLRETAIVDMEGASSGADRAAAWIFYEKPDKIGGCGNPGIDQNKVRLQTGNQDRSIRWR